MPKGVYPHKPMSEECKKKLSLKLKGRVGRIWTDEDKKKMSIIKMGCKGPRKGVKLSDETKLKISRGHMGLRVNLGRKHTEETKAKLRKAHEHRVITNKDTKPERMMQLALTLEGIPFKTHIPMFSRPDIFIEPNICLFVDGDYWHTQPKGIKRDIEVNHKLPLMGYHVIRVWEHDILKDVGQCAKNIIKIINQIRPMEKKCLITL